MPCIASGDASLAAWAQEPAEQAARRRWRSGAPDLAGLLVGLSVALLQAGQVLEALDVTKAARQLLLAVLQQAAADERGVRGLGGRRDGEKRERCRGNRRRVAESAPSG